MVAVTKALAALLCVAFLASCGGGDPEPPQSIQSSPPAARLAATSASPSSLAASAIDLSDAIAILKMIVGLDINGSGEPTTAYQAFAADVDANGKVELSDAILVLKRIVGLEAATEEWAFFNIADGAPSAADVLNPGQPAPLTATISGSSMPNVVMAAVLRGDVMSTTSFSYSWIISTKPDGSQAVFADAQLANASFIADAPGNYDITLTVSDGTGNSNVTVVVTGTVQPYFKHVANAFSDPTKYYLFHKNISYNSVSSLNSTAIANPSFALDLNNDGKKEFILVMQNGPGHGNLGGYVSDPCATTTIIHSLQGDKFVDVSDQYLEGDRDFKACSWDNIGIVDVNNDGKPDMFFPTNQEDGRSISSGADFTSPIVGWISQPNSKYKLHRFGIPKWYGSIGHGIDGNGKVFITAGPNNLRYVWNGSTMEAVNDPGFPMIGMSAHVFLSSKGEGKETDILISQSPGHFTANAYYKENGVWNVTADAGPTFKFLEQAQWTTWSNDTRNVDVGTLEGYSVPVLGIQSGTGLENVCKIKLYKDKPSVVLAQYVPTLVPNYISGITILETANGSIIRNVSFYGVLELVDKKLTYKKVEIIGEDNTAPGPMHCMDVNNDGYDDLVVSFSRAENYTRHLRIYINQKDGTFKKLQLTENDKLTMNISWISGYDGGPVDFYGSTLGDYDGDGKLDFVMYPKHTAVPDSSIANNLITLHRAIKTIE